MTSISDISAKEAQGVHRRLRKAWRKERRFVHLRGLCSVLLWAVALVLADFLIDWMFLSSVEMGQWGSSAGRVGLLAADLGILLWVAYRKWLRQLHRFDPIRLALEVEKRHPELHSALVSYIQLQGPLPADSQISPALLKAFQERTITEAAPINFREIISYRQLKKIALVSLLSLAMFAAISVNWSEFFTTLLSRMLNPTRQIAYPTRTHIVEVKALVGTPAAPCEIVRAGKAAFDDVVGEIPVKYGDATEVFAICSGAVPTEGTLRVKPADGNWEQLTLRQGDGNSPKNFRHRFDAVFQDVLLSFKIGDTHSQTYRVRVIPPPRIAKARVHVKYPDYTGLGERDVDDLNLQVPEGSDLTWELKFDMPLRSAQMIQDPTESPLLEPTTAAATAPTSAPVGRATSLELGADGRTASCRMTAGDSFPYRFRWVEREHGYEYGDDVRYLVQVDQDVPPEVEIVRPTQDAKATIDKVLKVRYKAQDNYGLDKVWISAQLNDDPAVVVPPLQLTGKNAEGDISWTLKDTFRLKEGDNVLVALGVSDNHKENGQARPKQNRSRSLRLTIVSKAEYLQWIADERARVLKEIETYKVDETEASKAVGSMESSPGAPATSTAPASSPVE